MILGCFFVVRLWTTRSVWRIFRERILHHYDWHRISREAHHKGKGNRLAARAWTKLPKHLGRIIYFLSLTCGQKGHPFCKQNLFCGFVQIARLSTRSSCSVHIWMFLFQCFCNFDTMFNCIANNYQVMALNALPLWILYPRTGIFTKLTTLTVRFAPSISFVCNRCCRPVTFKLLSARAHSHSLQCAWNEGKKIVENRAKFHPSWSYLIFHTRRYQQKVAMLVFGQNHELTIVLLEVTPLYCWSRRYMSWQVMEARFEAMTGCPILCSRFPYVHPDQCW